MDLIYKINSVMLYDNQLDHDFLVLYNRKKSFTGELNWDIPYAYSDTFKDIYNMEKEPFVEGATVLLMEMAELTDNRGFNEPNSKFVNAKEFITLEKTRGSHLPNYNGYNIYWNETKSGINLHEFEVAGVWNKGASSYSSYRIWENKCEREKSIRDNKLEELFKS